MLKLHTKKTGRAKRDKITAIGRGKLLGSSKSTRSRPRPMIGLISICPLSDAAPLGYRLFDKLPNLVTVYVPVEKVLLGLVELVS